MKVKENNYRELDLNSDFGITPRDLGIIYEDWRRHETFSIRAATCPIEIWEASINGSVKNVLEKMGISEVQPYNTAPLSRGSLMRHKVKLVGVPHYNGHLQITDIGTDPNEDDFVKRIQVYRGNSELFVEAKGRCLEGCGQFLLFKKA